MKNNLTSGSARSDQEPAANVIGRKRPEDCGKHVKIITDGSKMGDKVGYAIVKEEHTIKKRNSPQNTVFSAEQSAVIGAMQSEKNSRHEIVIITNSLSMIMAAKSSSTSTKNPKKQTNRKMMDQEGLRITLLWVPSHKGIPGNKKTDQVAKETLDEDIPTTERYPPDDLKKPRAICNPFLRVGSNFFNCGL
jgi:ribonuclease HI